MGFINFKVLTLIQNTLIPSLSSTKFNRRFGKYLSFSDKEASVRLYRWLQRAHDESLGGVVLVQKEGYRALNDVKKGWKTQKFEGPRRVV